MITSRMEQAIREGVYGSLDARLKIETAIKSILKDVLEIHREELAAAEDLARENAARSVETWVLAGGAKDDLHGIAQCLRQRGLHKGALARHDQELTERVLEEAALLASGESEWLAEAIRALKGPK